MKKEERRKPMIPSMTPPADDPPDVGWVFEFWFLAIAYMKLFKYEITTRKLVVIFTIVLILKLIHEYILHVWKVLDNYRAVDVLNNLLRFLNILD